MESFLNTILGAFLGGGIASLAVAWFTQRWMEGRERRNRRDSLRLDLYVDLVELILDNEKEIASRDMDGHISPQDLQKRRLRISHRLRLLSSNEINDAYQAYSKSVFDKTNKPLAMRSNDPDEDVRARDRLIALMRSEVQQG